MERALRGAFWACLWASAIYGLHALSARHASLAILGFFVLLLGGLAVEGERGRERAEHLWRRWRLGDEQAGEEWRRMHDE